ncbi:MAG TPA: ATP-binding protein [Phenylobacterium sp.]|nr:ATP-binding protein [Phenylobacterium sp.]
MRSIGARLAFWYALSVGATLVVLFAAGYQLLESRLTHGLDLLNQAEFHQLETALGPDVQTLDAGQIEERLRGISENGAILFYIGIHVPGSGDKFLSRNLRGQTIPDLDNGGKHTYTAALRGVGDVRVGEFFLPPFDVSIATSYQSVRKGMQDYVRTCAILLAVMLLGSVGVGFGISRVVLRPVRLIRETALRIGSDNLSERIPIPDVKDEVSDLARLLNATFDRLEAAFDQNRRFAYEASHELKTPLSLIRLHAEKMLSDGGLSPAHTEAIVVQIEELARLNHIIDELLFLSRADAKAIGLKLVSADPAPFLETFWQDAAALVEHGGRAIAHSHAGSGEALFEEKWIRQVLLNVVTNAINVSPPGGLITIRSELARGLWRVSVQDQGPGLSPEDRERIFDRFVRLGPATPGDRGSGLGLTISRSIIQLHGGRIYADAGEGGRGLRVTFEIPARTRGQIRRPASRQAA